MGKIENQPHCHCSSQALRWTSQDRCSEQLQCCDEDDASVVMRERLADFPLLGLHLQSSPSTVDKKYQ
jgi:hypothetical protein